ncbi:hypothetical protein [Kibdelosporangium philippinense]|uniref:hypothetical protein n=1 Tax=Kibdelosporangium philippinense TaxID=211113 RepID=UPI00361DCE0C
MECHDIAEQWTDEMSEARLRYMDLEEAVAILATNTADEVLAHDRAADRQVPDLVDSRRHGRSRPPPGRAGPTCVR